MVMNTLHMKPSGMKIMGKDAKYVHENVADQDITSEYPSAINTCNISNETLVGKIYLEHPDEIEIPICKGFEFRGEDREKYKMDKGNYLLEVYTENDVLSFGTLFLGLPDPEDILKDIAKII